MAEEKDLKSLQKGVDELRDKEIEGDTSVNSASDERAEERIEKAVEASQKSVVARKKPIGEDAERPKGPVGLDIGTTHIIVAQNKPREIYSIRELNAFFTIPKVKFAKQILKEKEIKYYERQEQYYIIGYSAQNFANMFNLNTRRPMKERGLSSNEDEGIKVIEAIVNTLIQKPKTFGEMLCFAIPGDPIDEPGALVYHEAMIKRSLGSIGYSPISINEGMAVVLSELSDTDFTGIGISMGGGMCNVCLSYLSFPVISYSIQMGGDYIDTMVGKAVGEPATKVKTIKEEELDLSSVPKDRVITALHIFYDELMFKLLESLQRVFS